MPSASAQTRLMPRQPAMASTEDAAAEPFAVASPLKTGIICQATRRARLTREGLARELQARGRARATVTRRLSTIAGFCKYAMEEELLDHLPEG
jgi:hypothetical protein